MLLQEVRKRYTIILVTHNMQQAARVSEMTAFLMADENRVGQVIEYNLTSHNFTRPSDSRTEDYISGRFGRSLRLPVRLSIVSPCVGPRRGWRTQSQSRRRLLPEHSF